MNGDGLIWMMIGFLYGLAVFGPGKAPGLPRDEQAPLLYTFALEGDSVRVWLDGGRLTGWVSFGEITRAEGGFGFVSRGDSVMIRTGPDSEIAGTVQFIGGTVILSAVSMLEDTQRGPYIEMMGYTHAKREMIFDMLDSPETQVTLSDSARMELSSLSVTLGLQTHRNLSRKSKARRANLRHLFSFFDPKTMAGFAQ